MATSKTKVQALYDKLRTEVVPQILERTGEAPGLSRVVKAGLASLAPLLLNISDRAVAGLSETVAVGIASVGRHLGEALGPDDDPESPFDLEATLMEISAVVADLEAEEARTAPKELAGAVAADPVDV